MHSTKVGVDLAKDVIQVCVYKRKKVQSNIEMTPRTNGVTRTNGVRSFILNLLII